MFQISPNPANDKIKVTFEEESNQKIRVTILNVIGQVMLNKEYENQPGDIVLDLPSFDKGIYILVVARNDWSTSEKFLIE